MNITHYARKYVILLLGVFTMPVSATISTQQSSFWNVQENYQPTSIEEAQTLSTQLLFESPDIKDRLLTALKAASVAGNVIRQIIEEGKGEVEKIIKSDGTPVTKADIQSSEAIEKIVRERFPLDGFISEEEQFTGKELTATYTWVIDPLDGTDAFTKKRNDWGIHVAVLKNKQPLIGVNYYPALDKAYFAAKDSGAYLVTANSNSRLGKSEATLPLTTLRKPLNELMVLIHDSLKQKNIWSGEEVEIGSVGLRLMNILDGNPAFLIIEPKRCYERCGIYDFLSSDIILREAGMDSYTDCNGDPLEYTDIKLHNGIVATPNMEISKQVIDIFQAVFKSQK